MNNFGTPIWSKESSGHQAATINLLQTNRFEVNSDISPFQIQNNELGIITSFSTSGSPWMTSFDSKTVSGTNLGIGNCVITKITDAGNLAYFKNRSSPSHVTNESQEQSTINCDLYPNPNDGQFVVEANEEIDAIEVFEISGQRVLTVKGNNSDSQVIDLRSIPKGLYFVSVSTKHKLFKNLVLIE